MNDLQSDHTWVGTPVELDALQNFLHLETLDPTLNSRLPSTRPTSSDTANDPTPDGNGMEFGNDTCHSPHSDSLGSIQAEDDDNRYTSGMGTPNSFIGGPYEPASPGLFSDQRERLFSTSSSVYTYSPYSPKDGMFSTIDSSGILCDEHPHMHRQNSLALVEEVLRSAEHPCQQFTFEGAPEPSPVTPYQEDSSAPPYPSPSFSAHFNASTANAEVITSSQTEQFFEGICLSEAPAVLQCEGSPNTTENTQDYAGNSNNNSSNGRDSRNATPVCTESDQVVLVVAPVSTSVNCPAVLARESSKLPEFITESMPTNSLDASQMLQDFMDSTSPVAVDAPVVVEVADIVEVAECSPSVAPAVETRRAPKKVRKRLATKSPVQGKAVPAEEPSTSKTHVGDDVDVRRQRNNEACRQSRKRRKDKKAELENMADHLAKENVDLEQKIQVLEVECKKMRQEILSTMTNTRN